MKLLIVIDYQVDFVSGALGFPGAERLDAGIAEKVRAYGKGRVYFTVDTHAPEYLSTQEGRNLPCPTA
jgi:nicotinamidase/pyrazinamidase